MQLLEINVIFMHTRTLKFVVFVMEGGSMY